MLTARRILLTALLAALLFPAPSAAQQREFRIARPLPTLRVGAVDTVKFDATADNGRRVASPAGRCLSYTPTIVQVERNVVMRALAPGRGVLACAWMPGSEGLYIDTASVVVVHEPEPDPEPEFRLLIHSGDGQTAAAGEVLDDELVVEVRDGRGARVTTPLAVEWTTEDGEFVETEGTGSDGRAGAVWRLGTRVGEQTARACVAGYGCVTFRATATEPDGWDLALEWCHPRTSLEWRALTSVELRVRAPGVPEDSAWVRAVRVWPDGRRAPAHDVEWTVTGSAVEFRTVAPGTMTPCGPA